MARQSCGVLSLLTCAPSPPAMRFCACAWRFSQCYMSWPSTIWSLLAGVCVGAIVMPLVSRCLLSEMPLNLQPQHKDRTISSGAASSHARVPAELVAVNHG